MQTNEKLVNDLVLRGAEERGATVKNNKLYHGEVTVKGGGSNKMFTKHASDSCDKYIDDHVMMVVAE